MAFYPASCQTVTQQTPIIQLNRVDPQIGWRFVKQGGKLGLDALAVIKHAAYTCANIFKQEFRPFKRHMNRHRIIIQCPLCQCARHGLFIVIQSGWGMADVISE